MVIYTPTKIMNDLLYQDNNNEEFSTGITISRIS